MTCTGDRYYENDKATAFDRDYANGLSFCRNPACR